MKEGSRVQGFSPQRVARGDKGSKWLFIVTTAGVMVLLDYTTKRLIETFVSAHETIPLLPFLRVVHVKNPGAAFGIFSNLSNSVFIIISIVAIILLAIYLLKTVDRLEVFSISLIVGGAIGNLIDRLTIGKVIDFIDFFVGRWHWPAFNVADSALTVGIIIFILSNIRQWKHRRSMEL